jgi:serine/threonine protein kinase
VHKTVEREVRVLKQLRHPNIVSLLDSFKYKGRTCIVMEYVQRTVLECLKAQPHGLGMLLTRQITWQLVKALEYMHNQKVRALAAWSMHAASPLLLPPTIPRRAISPAACLSHPCIPFRGFPKGMCHSASGLRSDPRSFPLPVGLAAS